MKATLTNGQEITIDFKHQILSILTKTATVRAVTDCIINGGYPVRGSSRCHVHDQFDRSVGRKISLTRAIYGFSKADRTIIWNEYFKHCKK